MNHSTITDEQAAAIEAMLARMPDLPSGIGSKENACSIAAINLALTGKLTDVIPGCMSIVIAKWIIKVQDSAPAELRNSERWRRLLPLAAGTGRDKESGRASVAMDWMWSVVLPQLQPLADRHGFGESWRKMCDLRTANAADAAYADANAYANANAADAAADAAANAYAYAYAAADAATYADAAADAAYSATYADADAAYSATYAANAANAANAAHFAANAAAYAARSAAADFWHFVDPCGCLERMINLPEGDRK